MTKLKTVVCFAHWAYYNEGEGNIGPVEGANGMVEGTLETTAVCLERRLEYEWGGDNGEESRATSGLKGEPAIREGNCYLITVITFIYCECCLVTPYEY